MVTLVKDILQSQYDAALCMLNDCVAACDDAHWNGDVATVPFRRVVYHTLFFTDLYLSPTEDDFELRELHARGGDDRSDVPSPGLDRLETLEYVRICREKVADTLNAETEGSLRGPSGFSWRRCTRAELHVYNIRHVQHHTGAMAAYLRRVDPASVGEQSLRWVGHGWR